MATLTPDRTLLYHAHFTFHIKDKAARMTGATLTTSPKPAMAGGMRTLKKAPAASTVHGHVSFAVGIAGNGLAVHAFIKVELFRLAAAAWAAPFLIPRPFVERETIRCTARCDNRVRVNRISGLAASRHGVSFPRLFGAHTAAAGNLP